MTDCARPEGAQYGAIFAFQILPTIIFVAAFFAILYYVGLMQLIVALFAGMMRRFMKASGAESLNVAASIFMGQTEAPLTIRPYLPEMTTSELMTVMTSGMAHISGGIMAAYILFGVEAQHLLTAVIMTAPGTDDGQNLRAPKRTQRRWSRSRCASSGLRECHRAIGGAPASLSLRATRRVLIHLC